MKLFVALLVVAALVQLSQAASPYTLDFVVTRSEKGMTQEAARNPAVDATVINLSLNRATLVPCGMRVMHTHGGVDEVYVATAGKISVAVVAANGSTVVSDTLNVGQAFVIPRDLVHTVVNPSCTDNASFMNFLTAFDTKTVNVASSAFNILASPFSAYVNAGRNDSLQAAIGLLAFDPRCLRTCGLGTQGNQKPASGAVFGN